MHDPNSKKDLSDKGSNVQNPGSAPYRRYQVNGQEVVLTQAEFQALVRYFEALRRMSRGSRMVIKTTDPERDSPSGDSSNRFDQSRKVR